MTTEYDIRLAPVNDIAQLESLWTDLEERCSRSYFQSWGWIGTWLEGLPGTVSPWLISILAGDRLVGMAVICRNRLRYPLFAVNALLVHETGNPDFDRLTIEHNGFLLEEGHEAALPRAIATLRESFGWHEIRVNGVDEDRVQDYCDAAEANGLHCVVRSEYPCYSVDLMALQKTGKEYLSTLSSNTRYQIRRSIRDYEKRGQLQLTVASEIETAEEFMLTLKEWHQKHWTAKGQPGAFGTEWTRAFHESLLRQRFALGEVQVIRVSCGDDAIAYLYNFVCDGKVYCYQSGLRYGDNPRLKPGLVAHALAAQHNLALGNSSYDFLMGHERYKENLGDTKADMYWLSLRRPLMRYRLHDSLATLKGKIRSRLGRSSTPPASQ